MAAHLLDLTGTGGALPLRNRLILRNVLRRKLKEDGQKRTLRQVLYDFRINQCWAYALPLEDIVSALEWPEFEDETR